MIYVKAGLCHCTMLYDLIFQLFLWLLWFVKICLNRNLQKLRIKHQPMKRSVCFRTRGWNDVMNIQFCIREQRALFVDSIQLILGYMQFCVAPLLGPIWNKDVYIDTVKPLLALITLFQFFTSHNMAQQIKLGIWTNAIWRGGTPCQIDQLQLYHSITWTSKLESKPNYAAVSSKLILQSWAL